MASVSTPNLYRRERNHVQWKDSFLKYLRTIIAASNHSWVWSYSSKKEMVWNWAQGVYTVLPTHACTQTHLKDVVSMYKPQVALLRWSVKAVMVVCGGLIIPEAQQCCTTFTTLFFPWWRSVGFLDYLETSSNQPTGITVTVASSQTCTQLSVACIKCWQAVWGWKKGCRDRASLLRIAHSLTLIHTGA